MHKKSLGLVSLAITGALVFGTMTFADIISGLSTTNISNDAAVTQLTLSKPSDAAIGDLLLANVSVNGGSPAIITPPSGWTPIAHADNDTNVSVASFYKIVESSEPATFTWSINHQTHAVGGITRYSGIDTIHPIDAVGTSSGRGVTAIAPSVTTTAANDQVIALFASDAGKNSSALFSTTSGMTKKYNARNTPFGPTTAAEDAVQVFAGVTGSNAVTISDNKDNDWAAQTVALRMKAEITENFEGSAANTNLNGQNGGTGWTSPWIGDTSFMIESPVAYDGSKAAVSNSYGQFISHRSFSPKTSGTLHFAMRKDAPDDGQNIELLSGTTRAVDVGIGATSQPQVGGPDWTGNDGANAYFIIQHYNVGTWDTGDIQFDTNTDLYRISINGGMYSSWKHFDNPVSSVDGLQFEISPSGTNVGPNYWDDIRITGQ